MTQCSPKPPISTELCSQLVDAIQITLDAFVAQERATGDFIYAGGTQADRRRAVQVATDAQIALWKLLYSNAAPPPGRSPRT